MKPLRFGIFLPPYHDPFHNHTLSIERDLALIESLDRMGFDEAWIGEHHSAGSETIASPEIFIAAAAVRTRQIRLGTGVVSASYHNPLWVAERAVQLDHMTKGRFMLGLGASGLSERARQRDAYLDRHGITFTLGERERPLPMDLVPRLLTPPEWQHIEAGVIQRLKALELFLADIYGCLLYTSPSPRDSRATRMPSSA